MKKILYIFVLFTVVFFLGWGSAGHRIINKRTNLSFPSAMYPFLWFPDSMAVHGSDADWNKNNDPTEEYRHYIDIEYYPEFMATGRIPQNWDSLVALHGLNFVIQNGYVPFAIIAYTDSVKRFFQLRDWRKAMLKAADLGHYVADAYNPLHCTRYYNGWFYNSISYGIHSRYETQLINRDTAYIQYSGENVYYVNDINSFTFNIVYSSNSYRDSVYRADSVAQVISGSNSSQLYYQNFWSLAGNFTIKFFKNASYKLMCLIYTAWVDAGSPIFIKNNNTYVDGYKLYQNYPNPFNSKSKIKYKISKSADIKINIYDIRGNEIFTLVNGFKKAGEYETILDGNKLSSGIYFYKLFLDNNSVETKKMILIK